MIQQNQSNSQPAMEQENNNPGQQAVITFARQPPPTLLRINADNQDKRAICIFWIIFFAVIIAISIASSFLPKGLLSFTNESQLNGTYIDGCKNPNRVDANQTVLCNNDTQTHKMATLMLNLTRQNQFVAIFWNFTVIDNTIKMKDMNITANVTLYSLNAQVTNGVISKITRGEQQQSNSQTNLQLAFNPMFNSYHRDDSSTLYGFYVPVFAIRQFLQQSLLIIAQMTLNITQFPNVSQINSYIQVVNPQFTRFTFVIRYLFFAFSLVACVLYIVMFCKIPATQRILQQKMIVGLSVLLVFFNDPIYPITVMYPNKASSYFSVFFLINFTLYVIFLWIIFVDRIYHEDGQKQTNLINPPRIIYIVVTYILVLVLYTLIAFDHIQGMPVIQPQNIIQNRKYGILAVFCFILLGIGFIYVIFSYIRICIKLDTLLWRNQLFLIFSVFFIIMTIAMFFVNGFAINTFAGNRVLLLFTMMNIYTFYLQYMYSMSRQQRQRVRTGQVQAGGTGLLETRSRDDDFVDLQFENMSVGSKKNDNKKLQEFVDRNKKLLNKQNDQQQMYSPKYGKNYANDLKSNKDQFINPKIEVDEDNKTDFFNQGKNEQQDDQNIVKQQKQKHVQKKKDQFQQFSLDD